MLIPYNQRKATGIPQDKAMRVAPRARIFLSIRCKPFS
nr:MAG TPA: hypothetical protein [Caudoviricetes sp.]DAY97708.1 MAG TPA: hypothetical protein [Caudoviricetes sp.]